MRTPLDRSLARIGYYARNITGDLLPSALFRRRLDARLTYAAAVDPRLVSDRLRYYNRLRPGTEAGPYMCSVARIPRIRSMYYYDLKEDARYFRPDLELSFVQGDIAVVPERPSFVKSRPIQGDNRNSVLLRLNRFRHFYFPRDEMPFQEKEPRAVWRGAPHSPHRRALLSRERDPALTDIARTRAGSRTAFLTPAEQLRYRYVVSLEGHDVATNLKWILASNSLCLMPKPTVESWFMEGTLESGKHYVELRDDLEDLEEKVIYCQSRPDEVRAMIRQANEHARRFFDESMERLLSLLVMHRYFVATGQLAEDPRVAAFWRS